jgi:hypothetical protein
VVDGLRELGAVAGLEKVAAQEGERVTFLLRRSSACVSPPGKADVPPPVGEMLASDAREGTADDLGAGGTAEGGKGGREVGAGRGSAGGGSLSNTCVGG